MSLKPSTPDFEKLSNAELCFLVALASWAMLFGALILCFILARIKNPLWPPPYISSFPITLPCFSTITLGVSSLFITKALQLFRKKSLDEFKFFWSLGILTGIFFGILQFVALKNWMTFDIRQHVYSSSVAFLIIFHGLHYAVGLSGLIWKYFKQGTIQSLRLWSWFWHFLGVVWLAIFLSIAI